MTRRLWGLPHALAAAWVVLSPAAFAQQPYTLQQAFEATWARQPEQRAAGLRRDAAAAGLQAAQRWAPEPLALELGTQTDRFSRNQGSREHEATLTLPLWLPGQRSRTQALAAAESAAVESHLAAAQWRVAGEVRSAHWAHLLARLDLGVAQQRRSNAQRLAADVALRVKAGDLARADGHQADAALAASESAVAQALATLTDALQHWAALTGDAPLATGDPEPEAPPGAAPDPSQHPALRELASKLDTARHQRDLASTQTRANPELMLGAVRERGEFGERYGQALKLGVRIPLTRHSASQAQVATAGADALEAETALALAQERVQADVRAASARAGALKQALDAAQRRAQLAAESRGFFDKSFSLGETDLPTRLRVELDHFEAQRQVARSRIELSAALSGLRQALGLLPQ